MTKRTEQLLEELKQSIDFRAQRLEAVTDAKLKLKEARDAYKGAALAVEEIQAEILTGKSGRPILDRIAEREEETADERQRGVAATPERDGDKGGALGALTAFDVYERRGLQGRGKLLGTVHARGSYDAGQFLAKFGIAITGVILSDRRPSGEALPRWIPAEAAPPASVREPKLTSADHADGRGPLRCSDPGNKDCRCPACLAAIAEPETPRHVHWTSADLEEELERAVRFPLGEPAHQWTAFRAIGGITDVQIVEVLRAIWPQSHAFQEGNKGRHKTSPGYTIHGGVHPAFWVGPRRPETLGRPTLDGKPLVDRIRSILKLPKAPPAVLTEAAELAARAEAADKAPVKKGRGRPRKGAEVSP